MVSCARLGKGRLLMDWNDGGWSPERNNDSWLGDNGGWSPQRSRDNSPPWWDPYRYRERSPSPDPSASRGNSPDPYRYRERSPLQDVDGSRRSQSPETREFLDRSPSRSPARDQN